MMRFFHPEVFYLLLALPLLVLAALVLQKRSRSKLKTALGERLAPFLMSSVSDRRKRIKLSLQMLCLFFLIIALSRPQGGARKESVETQGLELMLLVDVSNSMMAEDVQPNRLGQVKAELSKLIEMLVGNKIGLVAFAGSAATLSPLTTDPGALKMYLDSLSPLSVSSQGTSFKEALEHAKIAFEKGGVGKDQGASRVILVVSDGEDQEPGALELAKNLVQEGIRVFGLAYGTEKGAPIPERDPMGFLRGYKKDAKGETIMTSVKGKALSELAKLGKGSFYHASFGGNHLRQLVEDFNKLEKTQFQSEMSTQYAEWFQPWLVFALVLAVIELFLSDKRPIHQHWKGRFEVPSA